MAAFYAGHFDARPGAERHCVARGVVKARGTDVAAALGALKYAFAMSSPEEAQRLTEIFRSGQAAQRLGPSQDAEAARLQARADELMESVPEGQLRWLLEPRPDGPAVLLQMLLATVYARDNPNVFYEHHEGRRALLALPAGWSLSSAAYGGYVIWLRFDLSGTPDGVRVAWTYCGDVLAQAAEHLGQPLGSRQLTVAEVRELLPDAIKEALQQ